MFTDDYTHYTYIKFLHTKDQTLQAYKTFVTWAHTQHCVSIKHLHSDHGGEFLSHDFTNFLYEQGTEWCLTTANTLQHNCKELTVDDSNSLLWIDRVYSDSGVRGTKAGDD